VRHDSLICVTCLIHACDMTHLYMQNDSFIPVTWLIYICDTDCVYNNSLSATPTYIYQRDSCVTWLIYMCDMTHSYAWHDSFICVPMTTKTTTACQQHPRIWASPMRDTTRSHVWHDSFIRVTWLIYMFDNDHDYQYTVSLSATPTEMNHSYAWHHSFICAPSLRQRQLVRNTHERISAWPMWNMIHSYV